MRIAKVKRRRGRPSVRKLWDRYLRLMDEKVLSGITANAAAVEVVREHFHRMPSGSTFVERTRESTVRMLKKHYPDWVAEQERLAAEWQRFEELKAKLAPLTEALAKIAAQPRIQAMINAFGLRGDKSDIVPEHLRQLTTSFGIQSDDYFKQRIKSQNPVNKVPNNTS